MAWNKKGDYDKAIADSNEAIKLNKTYAKAYNNRGVALSRKRDYDKAIADFNQAIKLNPKDASAYFNRAHALEAKGALQQALSDFKKFSELAPSDPTVRKRSRVWAAREIVAGEPDFRAHHLSDCDPGISRSHPLVQKPGQVTSRIAPCKPRSRSRRIDFAPFGFHLISRARFPRTRLFEPKLR